MTERTSPVMVALDVRDAETAVRLAKRLVPHVGAFKVGLRLLHGPGPALIAAISGLGLPVFADAKLHDIPSQVEGGARALARHGARWVTAHVSGGRPMLEAAVGGLAEGADGRPAGILGVTVLTSLDGPTLSAVGIQLSPGKLVAKMAKIAALAGCEGVVCAPQELGVVAGVAPGLITVTPGIRPTATDDDQARTMTPADAMARGATWLVVGRPITAATDPVAAAAAITALATPGQGAT